VFIINPRRTDYTGLTSGLPHRVGERKENAPEPKALK
jgi:circadian clock protein KaiC